MGGLARNPSGRPASPPPSDMRSDPRMRTPLSAALSENENILRSVYADCSDAVFRRFAVGGQTSALLLYIEGLTNVEEIDRCVLAPLMLQTDQPPSGPPDQLANRQIPVSGTKPVADIAGVVEEVSIGNPVLLIDGQTGGMAFSLPKWEKRNLEEPKAEPKRWATTWHSSGAESAVRV